MQQPDRPPPSPPPGYRERGQESGFTLIELLVTIGIIVILIGILLPVVAAVRKAGYATATKQEIATIASACQAYFGDFHSYPGPVATDDLEGAKAPVGTPGPIGPPSPPASQIPYNTASGPKPITSSENLVLGLTGGLTAIFTSGTPTATDFNYSVAALGQGPQSLNYLLNSQKQTSAYFTPKPEELAPTDPTTGYQAFNTVNAPFDSTIPEYQDHIPGQVTNSTNGNFQYGPILYMRARVGATSMLYETTGVSTGFQYNLTHLAPYGFTVAGVNTTDFPVGSTGYADSAMVYIANPAISGTPKGKDAFILISAGSDRVFGTKDDIISGN